MVEIPSTEIIPSHFHTNFLTHLGHLLFDHDHAFLLNQLPDRITHLLRARSGHSTFVQSRVPIQSTIMLSKYNSTKPTPLTQSIMLHWLAE